MRTRRKITKKRQATYRGRNLVLGMCDVLLGHYAVCIVSAAAIVSVGWDITRARDGGKEDGEGIHENKMGGCEEQRGGRSCLGSKEPGFLSINEVAFIPNGLS